MVLARGDVRGAHAVDDGLPGRGGRGADRRCRRRGATSSSAARERWRSAGCPGASGRSWSEQSAGIGAVQALGAGAGLPVREPVRRRARRSREPAVRHLPRHLRRAGAGCWRRRRGLRWRRWRRWGARCCSPRSTRTWRARGACRCRALSIAFLLLLGLAVAATSQITGVLLVFALLVTPAATRPGDHGAPGAEPRADRRDRPGGRVARAWDRLLLGVPGGVLRRRASRSRSMCSRARGLGAGDVRSHARHRAPERPQSTVEPPRRRA